MIAHEPRLQASHYQAAKGWQAETETQAHGVSLKKSRQSKNVEHGKSATKGQINAHEMFGWNGDPPSVADSYTGIAKRQLKDQNAFATGRRMGLEAQHKAIETGKLGKNSAMITKGPQFPKRDRNPFSKAKGN